MSEGILIDRRALDLFEAALDWPETGDDLDARLVRECAGDTTLLAAVRRLVARDKHATRAIPTNPPVPDARRSRERPERIARWRLHEIIGSGGMGTVYRAERDDGVFEQTVAIKLLRPGLLSAAAEARFADERRMLARLRHPNIAQIYDGGTHSETGHAWLAMEYIVGSHITAYVTKNEPKLDQRLALFAATCDAVQHAHQNLVVHADIKPSNILVTPAGGVKLLDFGIAQWLVSVDQIPSTTTPELPSGHPWDGALTPAYAAPERSKGGVPTLVGDVFSLGVLLAEMLAVAPVIEPDIELLSILEKARAVDPAQRYGTVAALAEDIRRYRGHFPLQCRPNTWTYVTERFIRRHPAGVALGTLATVTLIGATILMSALYVRAETAREQADHRFQQLRQLAKFMIFDLYDEFARVPGTTMGRRTLVSTAQDYLDELSKERSAPFDLRLETQVGRARLATVAGVPGDPNLGDGAAARRSLDQVIRELEALQSEAPERADIRAELAYTLAQRAAIDIWYDQKAEAATPRLGRAHSLLASDRSARALEVRQLVYLREGDVADWTEKPAQLGEIAQKGLAELATWTPEQRQAEVYARGRARMLLKLGDSLYYTGKPGVALERYREADADLRTAMERWPDRPGLIAIRQLASWSIATTLSTLGRHAEAITEFDTAIAFLQRMRAFDKNDVALLYREFTVRTAQAETLSLAGRHKEAIQKMDAILAERVERMHAAPGEAAAERNVAYDKFMRAIVLDRARLKAEACRAFADAVAAFTEVDRKGHLPTWDRTDNLEEARKHLQACRPT